MKAKHPGSDLPLCSELTAEQRKFMPCREEAPAEVTRPFAGGPTGHTPGPWEVSEDDQNGQAVVSSPETEIATCWHHCVGSLEKEMRANARLIAAAPELLDACEALLERYRIMVAADGPECLQAIAAIAKARGTSCTCGDSAMFGNECKSCGARAEA